jgi:hypothetical protein
LNRRVSIALALLLTTVAGFVITTYGMNNGMFGGDGDAAPLQVQATIPATPAATAPPPQVVEQVVYRDEYVRVSAPSSSTGGEAAPQPAAPPAARTSEQDDEDDVATAPPQPTNPPAAGQSVEATDLQGTVSAIGNGTFTLQGTQFGSVVISTNSSTQYEGGQFDDLAPGVRVEAKVLAAGGSQPTGPDGSWVAVDVHMEDGD